MPTDGPFRVLSLDGGGMRGTYTATYLNALASTFSQRQKRGPLDIGTAFDLIVGTSTGGIIGCAIAKGVPLAEVVKLYRDFGAQIFPRKLPSRITLLWDLIRRPRALQDGEKALRHALHEQFGETTLGQVYSNRGIALAITAVELSQHRSWLFKTPHNDDSTNHRDDNYSLVDVCLATSAAPIYRSLAAINHPDQLNQDEYFVFADGGLWANNPVLVGLIEALQLAGSNQKIELYCIGTCPMPTGEIVQRTKVHRGLGAWKFGGNAASLSIDAQQFAYDHMARMLSRHVNRPCEIIRFPSNQCPASLMPHLGLDNTSGEAINALISQARTDSDLTNSHCGDEKSREGQCINQLFSDMKEMAG